MTPSYVFAEDDVDSHGQKLSAKCGFQIQQKAGDDESELDSGI